MTALDAVLVCCAALILATALAGATMVLVAVETISERANLERPGRYGFLAMAAVGGTAGLVALWCALLPWLDLAN